MRFDDDAAPPGALSVPGLYVFGGGSGDDEVCVAAVPTPRGWRCRSSVRDRFQHDYFAQESARCVQDWLQAEHFKVHYVTRDREAALARLATHFASEAGRPFGFLAPDPSQPAAWRAERALRHLEHGW